MSQSFAGRILDDQGDLKRRVIHVDDDGLITKIAASGNADHDFGDAAILPGAIDVHVHFREPGHTHKEDLGTGSISAAYGGVTGFVDMPNTAPPTTNIQTLQEKHHLAAQKSVIDYGFWLGGTWYTGNLAECLKQAIGVKVYLGATTGDLLLDDKDAFAEILKACAKADKPVILHAESQRVLNQLKRTERGLPDHDHARPPLAEVEAIYDVMKTLTGLKAKPRIHIAHTASHDAVKAANAAGFSLGVCPHHLLLDTTFDHPHPAYAKMNPPLRGPDAREALWNSYRTGNIPIVESDHAPHGRLEKEGDFHGCPCGVPGVETMVPLLVARAVAGDVDLATVANTTATGPANFIGAKDRGSIEVGKRADLAVYDLTDVTAVAEENLHAKCGWSPFVGMEACFPSHTFLAGRPVIQDKQLVAKPGTGAPI